MAMTAADTKVYDDYLALQQAQEAARAAQLAAQQAVANQAAAAAAQTQAAEAAASIAAAKAQLYTDVQQDADMTPAQKQSIQVTDAGMNDASHAGDSWGSNSIQQVDNLLADFQKLFSQAGGDLAAPAVLNAANVQPQVNPGTAPTSAYTAFRQGSYTTANQPGAVTDFYAWATTHGLAAAPTQPNENNDHNPIAGLNRSTTPQTSFSAIVDAMQKNPDYQVIVNPDQSVLIHNNADNTLTSFDKNGTAIALDDSVGDPASMKALAADNTLTSNGTTLRYGLLDSEGDRNGFAYQQGSQVISNKPFIINGAGAVQGADGTYYAQGLLQDVTTTGTGTTTATGTGSNAATSFPSYDPATKNPGFPSGTPVPGTASQVSSDALNAIDPNSTLGKSALANAILSWSGNLYDTTDTLHDPTGLASGNPVATAKLGDAAAQANIQVTAVNDGKQYLVWDPTAKGLHLYDATTGADETAGMPGQGTMVFADGTRVDVKAGQGVNIVAGNTLISYDTTGKISQNGSSPGAVKAYLGANAVNPLYRSVQDATGWNSSNGVAADGTVAWIHTDATHFGASAPYYNETDAALAAKMNAPETNLPKEQAYALNPGYAGYVPPSTGTDATHVATDMMQGWTTDTLGTAPSTKGQVALDIVSGVFALIPPGVGELATAVRQVFTSALRGLTDGVGLTTEAVSKVIDDLPGRLPRESPPTPGPTASATPETTVPAAQAEPAISTTGVAAADTPTLDGVSLWPDKDGPSPTDVQQLELGNCWLMSTMMGYARTSADKIKDSIKVNEDGTVTVSGFKDPNNPTGPATAPMTFNVDDVINKYGLQSGVDANTAPWVKIYLAAAAETLEKYQPRDGLGQAVGAEALENGCIPSVAMSIFGKKSVTADPARMTEDQLTSVLPELTEDGIQEIGYTMGTAGTKEGEAFKVPAGVENPGAFDPGHAYNVIGWTQDQGVKELVLLNPHYPDVKLFLTKDQFDQMFNTLTVAA